MRSNKLQVSLVFLACFFSTGLVAAADGPRSSTPTIQRLEILQTPDGPIIQGLFDRFGTGVPLQGASCHNLTGTVPNEQLDTVVPLHGLCESTVLCNQGTEKTPLTSCTEVSYTKGEICNVHPACPSSYCAGTVKVSCCGEPCRQIYPPECVGCDSTGSCH